MATRVYDKAIKEVRARCLALPETSEVKAWGHPTFRAGKKMFAAFGEAYGVLSIGLKVGHERQEELLKDERGSTRRPTRPTRAGRHCTSTARPTGTRWAGWSRRPIG